MSYKRQGLLRERLFSPPVLVGFVLLIWVSFLCCVFCFVCFCFCVVFFGLFVFVSVSCVHNVANFVGLSIHDCLWFDRDANRTMIEGCC